MAVEGEMTAGGTTANAVFTVGHSNHPLEGFVALLLQHGVTALADVRSVPHSRRHPQFNREALAAALETRGIDYVFLGRELGGRPRDPALYEHGRVSYERVLRTEQFRAGIGRVLRERRGIRSLSCVRKGNRWTAIERCSSPRRWI